MPLAPHLESPGGLAELAPPPPPSEVPRARRLGVAVVGLGRWGSKIARALAHVEALRVTALCDLEPLRARRAALSLGVGGGSPLIARQLERVLASPRVHAVVIATPTPSHAPLALLALAAGRHVMVEKPMASRASDAASMARAARASGLTLMVGHVLNYHRGVQALESRVASGSIGTLLGMACERFAPRETTECGWWTLGPHDVSLCQRFFGRAPDQIRLERALAPGSSPESLARLRFGDRWARLHLSHRPSRPRRSRLTLFGSRGTLVLDDDPSDVRVRWLPAVGRAHERQLAESWQQPLSDDRDWADPRRSRPIRLAPARGALDTPLVRELAHFARAVRTGTPPLTDASEGLSVLRVLELGERAGHAERGDVASRAAAGERSS